MSLRLCPITYAEAAKFVDEHHRHHRRPEGIDNSLLWPCATAKLIYTSEELP